MTNNSKMFYEQIQEQNSTFKKLFKVKEISHAERGAGLTEYALLLALMVLVALAAIKTTGLTLSQIMSNNSTEIYNAISGGQSK
jgi:Flp pilus assembly pilin Flp